MEAQPTKFTHEIYMSDKENINDFNFVGAVSHSLTLKIQEASLGMDKALEKLQQNMSKYNQEKEAKK
jgi:hypothetical protein